VEPFSELVSSKRPSGRVSTSPEEFENTVTVRLTVTLICHAHEAFRKRWRHDNHVISLPEFSSNKTKMAGDWCFFVDGKHLMVFSILRRGVDRGGGGGCVGGGGGGWRNLFDFSLVVA